MYLVINKWVIAVKVSNFSGQYLRKHWTLDIGVLGYIGIVWPKEHSPEVRSFPPETPCIYIYIYIYIYICMYIYVAFHNSHLNLPFCFTNILIYFNRHCLKKTSIPYYVKITIPCTVLVKIKIPCTVLAKIKIVSQQRT